MEFKKYYEYYLTLHQNKWNRRLHALGQLTTLLFVIVGTVYYIPIRLGRALLF